MSEATMLRLIAALHEAIFLAVYTIRLLRVALKRQSEAARDDRRDAELWRAHVARSKQWPR